jgi:DNA-binding MarR family transcriptional regulator
MILVKQIAVYLNLVHCKFKQYVSDIFRQRGIILTPEQFLLIDQLWKKDSIQQQKIADILMKDKNSVTKLVDAMEKKKLVKRIPDENDRRLNLIALTQKAKDMETDVTEVAMDAVNSIIRNISNDDLKLFVKVLMRMAYNMQSYNIEIEDKSNNNITTNGETI